MNASVTRGGSVRIGEGVRATQAHIGRTGALVVCGNLFRFLEVKSAFKIYMQMKVDFITNEQALMGEVHLF